MKYFYSEKEINNFNPNLILSLSKDDEIQSVTPRRTKCHTLSKAMGTKAIFTIIILLTISFNHSLIAQHSWFPKELNVQPFTANFLEPKAGFLFNTSNNKIRLDISTSQDILHIKNNNEIISIGADLFTFTRLRSENDFHFPVETIDYLFGLNSSFKKVSEETEFGLRFRFSHISAHLVDGQFDKGTNQWRDGRLPKVYSREFFEFFPFVRMNDLRFYIGLTYIFHSSPKEIKKGIFQIGGDYFLTNFSTQVFTPFIAYDFKLSGKEKYVGNNFINFGLKFGEFNKKGFSIYFSYISGKSVHGEYFDLNENYSSIGFNLDL
ncbi:Hypothetical protein IALB_1254 [Ignavibacterium album JCM 16511]|uniref:DUF1207 domain-containing protein n=1 Tax=Ignavibacterium album (strain DSM 19864 / JCM 16511 / NBRC 101810 / Mat9-16) TaxID=945713 RepID=I0AJ07_IGNAJ|nr:DUF1207 domain-containing protein [Ignavibacterium album]AFH48964.1 Hypothetical protein IALB_1254 [Ignavibacterium album JCM 16511]